MDVQALVAALPITHPLRWIGIIMGLSTLAAIWWAVSDTRKLSAATAGIAVLVLGLYVGDVEPWLYHAQVFGPNCPAETGCVLSSPDQPAASSGDYVVTVENPPADDRGGTLSYPEEPATGGDVYGYPSGGVAFPWQVFLIHMTNLAPFAAAVGFGLLFLRKWNLRYGLIAMVCIGINQLSIVAWNAMLDRGESMINDGTYAENPPQGFENGDPPEQGCVRLQHGVLCDDPTPVPKK